MLKYKRGMQIMLLIRKLEVSIRKSRISKEEAEVKFLIKALTSLN